MSTQHQPIKVGLTEAHGMAQELRDNPPTGVQYSFLQPVTGKFRWLKSPIKGFMREYESSDCDLIEAILSPISTNKQWILSLSNFQEAIAFNILGLPLPRAFRTAYITSLLCRENCRKIYFWSQAGFRSMVDYGGIKDQQILGKTEVIYPGIREVSSDRIRYSDRVDDTTMLFSGYFFRKGGVNVVDAFEEIQKVYPRVKLRLCCSEEIDFVTENHSLKQEYLEKIKNNSGIQMGRATRQELFSQILPETDIFLIPTYVETFGFAILEAMSFGLPIISTTHFAIPEMIQHEASGFLINTNAFDCEKLFRGYSVKAIPTNFREYVTRELVRFLLKLIESPELRKSLGQQAHLVATTKFSITKRNASMLEIYQSVISQ